MRLFIAIDLPPGWRELLATPQQSIGWLGHGVKWVDAQSIHLTLKFLGEVAPNVVDSITKSAADACRAFPEFSMRVKGTGVFPDAKRPRVYWAGIEAPETLLSLQKEIERAMEELGFEKEARGFSPHLTIARIKDPNGKQRMTEALLNFKLESEPAKVTEVVLMRSHLSEAGARYEKMARFPLKQI